MADSLLQLLRDPQHVAEHKQQLQALDEVNRYLSVASAQHALQSELASKADTADFLRKHSKLNPTSPTYTNDRAQLFAEHPRSDGTMVREALNSADNVRQTYLNAVSPGGADEFATGSPEQHAYMTRFRQTQDPIAARAHALNTAKGEEMIKLNVANKLFDVEKDFPAWDGNQETRPKVYNPDGSINYHEIGLLTARRAGEISGKTATAEAKSISDARDLLKNFNDDVILGQSPEAEKLKPILLKRIFDYETKTSAPVSAPPPTSVDSFLIRK